MKQTIKSILAFAAVLLCGGAWAAAPVVWWSSDFGTTAKVGTDGVTYVLNPNGNTVDGDGNLVIDSTASGGFGALVKCAEGNFGQNVSVLIKYSDLEAPSDNSYTMFGLRDTNTANSGLGNGVGVRLNGNGAAKVAGCIEGSTLNGYALASHASSGYMLFCYSTQDGAAVFSGDSLSSLSGGAGGGLHYSNSYIKTLSVGGPVSSTTYPAWNGLKIEQVAIFRDCAAVSSFNNNNSLSTTAMADMTLPEVDTTDAFMFNKYLTSEWQDTGYHLDDISKLAKMTFSGEMAGANISSSIHAASGWFVTQQADDTVTFEMQTFDNGYVKLVPVSMKIENGTVRIKGGVDTGDSKLASYFNQNKPLGSRAYAVDFSARNSTASAANMGSAIDSADSYSVASVFARTTGPTLSVAPVAKWTDFTGAGATSGIAKNGVTLKANGNTVAADGITIDGETGGATVTFGSAVHSGTIVVKYTGAITAETFGLVAMKSGSTEGGIWYDNTDGKMKGYWGNDWGNANVAGSVPSGADEEHTLVYSYGRNKGYVVGGSWVTIDGRVVYGSGSLTGADATLNSFSIGGFSGTTKALATGMKITSITVYDTAIKTDETNVGQYLKYWYEFSGNLDKSSREAVSIGGEQGASTDFAACGDGQAYITRDGAAHPYGTFSAPSDGYTVVSRLRSVETANSILWSLGNTSGDHKAVGLVSRGRDKVAVYEYGSSVSYIIDNVEVPGSITHYHDYALAIAGTKVTLYVDGVNKGSATLSNAPTAKFQWGGVHGGTSGISGLTRTSGVAIDDWKLYDTILSAADLNALASGTYPLRKPFCEAISLNFNAKGYNNGTSDGQDAAVIGEEEDSGALDTEIPGKGWIQDTDSNATGKEKTLAAGTIYGYHQAKQSKVTYPSTTVYWKSNNIFRYHNGIVAKMFRGYLDDGNTGSGGGAYVTVSNVPYKKYDVLVYCATDDSQTTRQFRPVTINDVSYSFDENGNLVSGSNLSNWGKYRVPVAELGKNVLKVTEQTASTLSVKGWTSSNNNRGGIAAIQIIGYSVVSVDGVEYASIDAAIAAAVADGKPITLLSELDAADFTIPADQVVTIANAEKLTLNGSAAFGGTGNVVLEFHNPQSYASSSDLIAYMKAAPASVTFKFFGENTSGFTLDFGQPNATFNSHVVFVGGEHTYKWKNNNTLWGANGTYANPTLLVEADTTVNFVGHDITGWSNTNTDGVLRVKKDGTLNFSKNGSGTVYFNQQIALDPGAVMNVTDDMEDKAFRMVGNVNSRHIYVAASEAGESEENRTATLNINGNKFAVPTNSSQMMGVEVGANSILKIAGNVNTVDTGSQKFIKYGDGHLVVTGTMQPQFSLSAGTATLSKKPDSFGDVNGALTINDSSITEIDVTTIKLGTNGTLDLTGCTALNAVLIPDVGRDASVAIPNITLPSSVADVTRVYAETKEEYANCSFKVANATGVTVKVRRVDGTLAETTVGDDNYAKMSDFGTEIRISGMATSFDDTFVHFDDQRVPTPDPEWQAYSGTLDYQELSGANMQYDFNPIFVNYDLDGETKVATKNTGVKLKAHPYIQGLADDWWTGTRQLTLAVVGTMPTDQKTIFIHMGNSNSGYTGLLLATGEKEDEVVVAWNDATTINEITRLSVPNASTARHVYIVTKNDDPVADTTTFTVYLDGMKWKTLEITPLFTIKGGIQVGSDFGGRIRSENVWHAANGESGVVNAIRLYGRVITDAEIAKYSVEAEFPYHSPKGSSARTFAAGAANWIETESTPWSNLAKDATEAVEEGSPLEGSSIEATLTDDVTITVNAADSGVAYEALNIKGTGAATFEKGAGSGAMRITGVATIANAITVKPDSLDLSTALVTLAGDGAVAFDYSNYDVSTTYETTKVKLTGEVEQNDAKITFTAPTTKPYHTVAMAYDGSIKQYVMTITPNHQNGASVYYDTTSDVTPGNQGGRVWNAPENPKDQTAVFPEDTIVFGYGSFNKPSWFFKDVGGSIFEFASNMSLGHGASGDAGKLFDGKTVKVNDGVTLTLRGSWRNVALGTVTTTGTGSIEFVADEGNHPYYEPTADAISGTAKIVVASGMTLTVSGSVGSPVEVNGTIKARAEIATITTTKPNCFVKVTVADGVYTYTPVEVTGEDPLPLDDIKPGESVTPAQDAKPIWEDSEPGAGYQGKYIVVNDEGALVVKSGVPANGLDSFKSYVLGLDPEDATSKPYLSGADTTSATTLKLIPAGVTIKEGYTVAPKLRVGTTPDSFSDDPTALSDGGFTITLPTEENDKVKYYQIEYTISK